MCILTEGGLFKNNYQMLNILTGSRQILSKEVMDNMVAVSNLASRMIAMFYAKAKKKKEKSFDEKRMYR